MKRAFLLVVLAALVAVLVLPVTAAATYSTPADCYACHAAGGEATNKVDFDVPLVNKTACLKCHWETDHYIHLTGAGGSPDSQCNSCHPSKPAREEFYYPFVSTPYGNFTTDISMDLSAAELHKIHVNGSWPQQFLVSEKYGYALNCVSCHAPAACDACHENTGNHGSHGSTQFSSVTYQAASGISTPTSVLDSRETTTTQCTNPACHDLQAAADDLSRKSYEQTDTSVFSYSTTWTAVNNPNYSKGTAYYSALASTATITFQGPARAELFGVANSLSGIAAVAIDGGARTSVDLYRSAAFSNRVLLATVDLPAGTHTITVKATGTSNPASGGSRVYLDYLLLRTPVSTAKAFKPDCNSCHAPESWTGSDRSQGHGYETVDHDADVASQPLGDSGKTCGDCHATDLMTEHARPTASSLGRGCTTCHPAPRNTFAGWNQSCGQSGCHATGSVTEMHANETTAHAAPTVGESAECADCHLQGGKDLATLHKDATTSTGETGCSVCHSTSSVPASNDCVTCHFTMAEHPSADHTSPWSLTGCIASGCHVSRDLVIEHDAKQPGVGCKLCHGNADAEAAIAAGNLACDGCHSGVQQEGSHRSSHAAVPALVSGSTTVTGNYAYYTGSEPGATRTVDCAGCHVSNLVDEHLGLKDADGQWIRTPRTDDEGNALTCASCHSVLTGQVPQAIAAGITKCDGCHVVHGPIDTIHRTEYEAAPKVDCAGCHGSNTLSGIHADKSVTVGDETLAGCALCHGYTSGTRGASIQAAIRTGDSECAACHEGYHADAEQLHVGNGPDCEPCHKTSSLITLHADRGCEICHDNGVRIGDIGSKTFDCASCHATETQDYHRDKVSAHRAPESQQCVDCHESGDVLSIHSGATGGPCLVCHDNTSRVPTLPATADCANCHAALSPPDANHYPAASHTATDGMAYGYACSACHKLAMKPEHDKASSGAVSCVTCHETKVDAFTTPWDQTCTRCHASVLHAEIGAKHVSATSGCSGTTCHAVSDVAALHSNATTTVAGVTYTACRVCHRSDASVPTTTACTDCHAGHGDLTTAHTASSSSACVACHETADVRDTGGAHATCATCHDNPSRVPTLPATADCANCHAALSPPDANHYPAESHAAGDATLTGTPSSCSLCHSLDMKSAHAGTSAGTISCVTCHETKVDGFTAAWDKTCAACHATKHDAQASSHDFSATNPTCGGTGCHVLGDVAAIHSAKGCGTCHSRTSTPTKDCAASGCHAGMGTDHHSVHDASTVIDTGCKGCHYLYIDDEHSKLGYSCATCHDSANSAVQAAIAAGNVDCAACHPSVNGNDQHANLYTMEFNSGNSSMHRVNSTLPGMRTSFVVNSTTYTWSLPTTTWLRSSWTSTSIVTCDNCHTFSSSAVGPHGSSVTVNIDPAYPGSYRTASLSGSGINPTNVVCNKCHTNFTSMNEVHSKGDHEGYKCVYCHSQTPHGWRLPRLLAYDGDQSPYDTISGGVQRISLESHSPNNWSRSDCMASCANDHDGTISSYWPSGAASTGTGTLSGTVKTTSGTVISGVSVRTDKGQTATTDSYGVYRFTGVAAGSYGITASKSGYHSQTKSVTIYANQTSTLDFSLVTGTSSVGSIMGVVKDSTGAAVTGVTVTAGSASVTTDVNGLFILSSVSPGTVTVTYGKTGYTTITKSVTVTANQTTIQNATLSLSNSGSISGKVTLSGTTTAASGVTVSTGSLTTSTAADGTYTLASLAAGTYSVTYAKSGYASQTVTVSVTAGAVTTQNVALSVTNLALNKTFSASRYESYAYAASKAGDASTSTFWWSDNYGSSDNTEWLKVDLGSSLSISSAIIRWYGSYYAREYRVYTSSDNYNWTQVYSTTSGTSSAQTVTFSSRTARYVRVECRHTGGNSTGYGIAELEVYK